MTEFENNYANGTAPFYRNLAEGKTLSMNGNPMLREEYNLIISKRDFGLYAKGIKISRHWSFNFTKKYFGLTGNAKVVSEKMNQLLEDFQEFKAVHVTHAYLDEPEANE